MIENTFANLIQLIVASNGRGHEELNKRIRDGTLIEAEAVLIDVHAQAQRVVSKLNHINRKLDDQPSNHT